MISKGSKSKEPYWDLSNLSQADIAAFYLNIKSIPCLIHSPLREDKHPSFALYCPKDTEVNYIDFSTKESGSIWTLLSKMWDCDYREVNNRVYKDLGNFPYNTKIGKGSYTISKCKINNQTILKCKVRKWKDYDIQYWNSYGISLKWLKYADVYPISHKIIIKNGIKLFFKADKYAYTYVEFKEKKVTLKIYQPFNKSGYKWSNGHDKSVISLWTKVPKKGEKLCICSSLKDALCLWANTNIPSLAIQGEGYSISNTAIENLKKRFNKIYICLDNDKVGLQDAVNLANRTGFTNIILPYFKGGKDISDYYKILNNKETFKQTILNLFK